MLFPLQVATSRLPITICMAQRNEGTVVVGSVALALQNHVECGEADEGLCWDRKPKRLPISGRRERANQREKKQFHGIKGCRLVLLIAPNRGNTWCEPRASLDHSTTVGNNPCLILSDGHLACVFEQARPRGEAEGNKDGH